MTPIVVSTSTGPGWAMVIAILTGLVLISMGNAKLLNGILKAWHTRSSEEGSITREAMRAAVEMMRGVRDSCADCRLDVISTVKKVMGAEVDKVIEDNRIEHKSTRACLQDIVAAEGREEDRTIKELQHINRTLVALSLPPQVSPPVLEPGSQVKDSAAGAP